MLQKFSEVRDKTLELEKLVNISEFDRQYLVPMGYMVPVSMYMSLDQMVYVAELRSSRHVHPTVRKVAIKIGEFLRTLDIPIYLDDYMDGVVQSRADQDIMLIP